MQNRGTRTPTNIERVAAILERDSSATIVAWLKRVKNEPELVALPLGDEERTGHLPQLLQELVLRLRVPRRLGTKAVSEGAVLHGAIRYHQGYSVSMLVEESRVLQVSIFETLQNNLSSVDFSLLLLDVMTIADEVDSQLKQTINSFMARTQEIAAQRGTLYLEPASYQGTAYNGPRGTSSPSAAPPSVVTTQHPSKQRSS